jgi:hypothetical protein
MVEEEEEEKKTFTSKSEGKAGKARNDSSHPRIACSKTVFASVY